MKCLSVKQPWASLIASGRKSIELRTWSVKYRGPLIICASAIPRADTDFKIGPLGVAVCLVVLDDIREPIPGDDQLACHPTEGRLCWVLTKPRLLPAIAVKGRQCIWDPDPDLLDQLGLVAP